MSKDRKAEHGIMASTYSARDLVRDAIAGILQKPGRSMLTMLGTVLGVGALVTILGLTETAGQQINAQFSALTATTVEVADAGSTNAADVRVSFPANADHRVDAINGVTNAGMYWPVPLTTGTVSTQPLTSSTTAGSDTTTLTAADPGALAAMGPTLSTGRLYDAFHQARGEHVAVLGSAAASQLGIARLNTPRAVFIEGHAYTVIGILANLQRHPELLLSVIIPTTTAITDYGPPQQPRAQMLVQTRLGAAQVVAAQIAVALRPDQPGLFKVTAPADPTTLRNNVAHDVNGLFILLAAVSLIVGALGIANTTLVAVMERVAEIGLRRSLGARRRHITAQFLTESLALGTAGGLAGTSLAVVVVVATAALRQWTAVLDTRTVLIAPLLGSVIGLFAGAYPALRAARIEPVDALRR